MRLSSMPYFPAIMSLALLSGCGDPGAENGSNGRREPEALVEGSWNGPAELMNCSIGENCELDRWANQSEFQVIVWNEDADVSSSDPEVLEVVSVERGNPIDTWCIFDCPGVVDEELSVIVRTQRVGNAEFIIDGPAGDQRRLPVHVADIDTLRLIDIVSDEPVDTIGALPSAVGLDAQDAEGEKLAVPGSWSIDDPDAALLHPTLFSGSDGHATLERSTSAIIVRNGPSPVSTTLRVTVGENELAFPVEL